MRRRMKKILAAALCISLLCSLAGCQRARKEPRPAPKSTAKVDDGNANAAESGDGQADVPLVVGCQPFSGQFNPFSAESQADRQAVSLTQVTLLTHDRAGKTVYHGIDGELREYNGNHYTYYGIADIAVDYREEEDETDYHITLRDDLVFSDGEKLTVDDLIFSLYVFCDRDYYGDVQLKSMPVKGLLEYQADSSQAGSISKRKVASYMKRMPAKLRKWKEKNLEGNPVTAQEKEHYSTQLERQARIFLSAGKGKPVKSIAGIQRVNDYELTLVTTGYNRRMTAALEIPICALHYYGDADSYNMEKGEFGFTRGDISDILAKNTAPMGAGPYRFVKRENNVVYYTSNELYYLGCPEIAYLQLKDMTDILKETKVQIQKKQKEYQEWEKSQAEGGSVGGETPVEGASQLSGKAVPLERDSMPVEQVASHVGASDSSTKAVSSENAPAARKEAAAVESVSISSKGTTSPTGAIAPSKEATTSKKESAVQKEVVSVESASVFSKGTTSPTGAIAPSKEATTPRRESAVQKEVVSVESASISSKGTTSPTGAIAPSKEATLPKRESAVQKEVVSVEGVSASSKGTTSPTGAIAPSKEATPPKKESAVQKEVVSVESVSVSSKGTTSPGRATASPEEAMSPKGAAASPVEATSPGGASASPEGTTLPESASASPEESGMEPTPMPSVNPLAEVTEMNGGTVDVMQARYSKADLSWIYGTEAKEQVEARTISDNQYHYIGVNAETVSVKGKAGSRASKYLRKALAVVLSDSRRALTESQEVLAELTDYPVVKESWVSPQESGDAYEAPYSIAISGEQNEPAADMALGYLKAAGYTISGGKVKKAPRGGAVKYKVLLVGGRSNSLYPVLEQAQKTFEDIGITLEITSVNTEKELYKKLSKNKHQLWVGSRVKEDLDLQLRYSEKAEDNFFGIQDKKMNQVVEKLQTRLSSDDRKRLYAKAFDIVLEWAVEVPVCEFQKVELFSTRRIDVSTIIEDTTMYYSWMNELQKVRMKA